MMKTRVLVVLVGALALAGSAWSQEQAPQAEVGQTLRRFFEAFENLDWANFTSFFSDDATMFQPRKFVRRAGSRSEIEAQFREIFPAIRGNQANPPYMRLQARDLRIQMLGTEAAIVTFHLEDRPGMLNRRTIVLQHRDGKWKIVHIHASELALP